jgi:hypothetical protein
MKDRVSRLRVDFDGDPADVKEWHALVDMMDSDSTQDFTDTYGRVSEIPEVVSGIGDDGLTAEESDAQ